MLCPRRPSISGQDWVKPVHQWFISVQCLVGLVQVCTPTTSQQRAFRPSLIRFLSSYSSGRIAPGASYLFYSLALLLFVVRYNSRRALFIRHNLVILVLCNISAPTATTPCRPAALRSQFGSCSVAELCCLDGIKAR